MYARFNTMYKLKRVGGAKENVIEETMNLQASGSVREYERNIDRLRKLFPTLIMTAIDGEPKDR